MSPWIVRALAAVAIMALAALTIVYWPAEVSGAPAATAPVAPGTPTPSQVSNARPEGSLTTVTLTPEAEVRLGVELATIERRNVQRTRMIGGEVIVPPGRSMTVSAPFAGVLLPPATGEVPVAGVQLAAGDEVLRIQPLPADVDVLRLRADARYMEEAIRLARDRSERAQAMYSRGEMSIAERDAAQKALDTVAAVRPPTSQYSYLESGKVSANEQTNAARPQRFSLLNWASAFRRVVENRGHDACGPDSRYRLRRRVPLRHPHPGPGRSGPPA